MRTLRRRPRSVWAALITCSVLSVLAVVGVLLPVLGLVGLAVSTTAGTLQVPALTIGAVVVLGLLLVAGLLTAAGFSRVGALSWVLGVVAVLLALTVSVLPIVATAISAVGEAQQVVPFILGLIRRATGA